MLQQGTLVNEFVFFLSSGDDVSVQRDLFQKMLETVDQQFRHYGDPEKPFSLRVDRWEFDAPYKTSNANQEFVRRARAAHVTIVLLSNEIRPGTQEELEGVLDEAGVQLAVIWMPVGNARYQGLWKFLRDNQDKFLYCKTGRPESADAGLAMLRVISAAVADITNQARRKDLFGESR